jgi:hypothetical protein
VAGLEFTHLPFSFSFPCCLALVYLSLSSEGERGERGMGLRPRLPQAGRERTEAQSTEETFFLSPDRGELKVDHGIDGSGGCAKNRWPE